MKDSFQLIDRGTVASAPQKITDGEDHGQNPFDYLHKTRKSVFDDVDLEETYPENPLLRDICAVLRRVSHYKEQARKFYFEVVLVSRPCPSCGGRMQMTRPSECSCRCGLVIDPTEAFQLSDCCGAKVVKKILHYACSCCEKTVPSKFLFDERIFDSNYFRQMMSISRENKRRRRDEIRRLLANSRSETLQFDEELSLSEIPGLEQALDDFIGDPTDFPDSFSDERRDGFLMDTYHEHILSIVDESTILFDSIPPLAEDLRLDRVRRFITLIYMEQDGEVDLIQHDESILVEKHEAYG
jgi:hypothetical protein